MHNWAELCRIVHWCAFDAALKFRTNEATMSFEINKPRCCSRVKPGRWCGAEAVSTRPGRGLQAGRTKIENEGVGAIVGALEFCCSMCRRTVGRSAERMSVEDIGLPDRSIARRGKGSDFAMDVKRLFSMASWVANLCHRGFAGRTSIVQAVRGG
jgi:hypothetical protein